MHSSRLSLKPANGVGSRATARPSSNLIVSTPRVCTTLSKRGATVVKSQEPGSEKPADTETKVASVAPPEAKTEKKAPVEDDKGMAAITGGISVVFGVAYLILVFLLDSRGGQMLPPPAEAFLP